jgi:hypothetical protein
MHQFDALETQALSVQGQLQQGPTGSFVGVAMMFSVSGTSFAMIEAFIATACL